MKHHARLLLLIILVTLSPSAQADLTPESVVVVVNGDSWASLTVANEYTRLRAIPESNIVVLQNISSFERMNIDAFRKEILLPVFDAIEQRGLTDQIDCITYSVDLPTAINIRSDAKGQSLPQVITPVASTNGLTYLHELVRQQDTDYLNLDINRYSRRVLPLPDGQALTQEAAAEYRRGMELYAQKQFEEATQIIESVANAAPNDYSLYYNLACCQALIGKNNAAMASLQRAVSLGWRDSKHLAADSDLTTLRNRADFKSLLKTMASQTIKIQPTRGFRAMQGWDKRGEPSDTGSRYMLSTMLGVTSGRGNSVQEVLECLRRAQKADGTAPNGTVYFLKNGNVRSTTRQWAFTDAQKQLTAYGVQSLTEDGILPQNKRDIAGAMIGTATFDWNTCKSTILPGAIVEHLTSCGSMMRERDTQTPCTDFIRAGAAGSSGAVAEPYALQAKFPNAFMHLHYARGSTLAEAYYQSLEGPYQLLIIGDPLCQPWGRTRRVGISGFNKSAPLKGTVQFKPQIVGRDNTVDSYELYVDGTYDQTVAKGDSFNLETSRYSDGEHTLAVIALHIDALETRDRSATVVNFSNSGHSVKLLSRAMIRAEFGSTIDIKLAAPGASSIEIIHLGRVVAKAQDDSGVVQIDTAHLGTGLATLRIIAQFANAKVRGPSFKVDVTPQTIRRRSIKNARSAPEGMLISIDNEQAVPLLDTYKGDWLTNAGIKDGKQFKLTGIFDGAADGILQIQLKTNTNALIKIDGTLVAQATNNAWHYTPVQLTPGTHSLRITGTSPKGNARLDLRIGTTGTRNLSDRWLRQGTIRAQR